MANFGKEPWMDPSVNVVAANGKMSGTAAKPILLASPIGTTDDIQGISDSLRMTGESVAPVMLIDPATGIPYVPGSVGGGSGGSYDLASPTTTSVGDLSAGTDISGMSWQAIIEAMTNSYQIPLFNSFSINSPSTLEVGESISGVALFSWSTSNPQNVTTNSISIDDVTRGVSLLSGGANDGSENINVGTITKSTESSHVFRATLSDTDGGSDTIDEVVLWRSKIWYGPSASIPSNSAEARSLPQERFTNSGNTFILNTGSSELNMVILIPAGGNLVSVIDLDAANANVTSAYVNTGVISVNDASGSPTNYDQYVLTLGVPYNQNQRHQVTIS